MKISELSGLNLNKAIAKALGLEYYMQGDVLVAVGKRCNGVAAVYESYDMLSTLEGWQFFEEMKADIGWDETEKICSASIYENGDQFQADGSTILEATFRAFVLSQLGEDVEV